MALALQWELGSTDVEVKVDDDTLTETTDYTYVDGTLTISEDYLATLTAGEYTITITGDADLYPIVVPLTVSGEAAGE